MSESLSAALAGLTPIEALRKIADEGECSINMMLTGCVGAVHSRRKNRSDTERVEVIGCSKHFALEYLAARSGGSAGEPKEKPS